jgi:hypothetical protein
MVSQGVQRREEGWKRRRRGSRVKKVKREGGGGRGREERRKRGRSVISDEGRKRRDGDKVQARTRVREYSSGEGWKRGGR